MTVAKRISLVSATLVAFSLVMGLLGVLMIHSIDGDLQSILVDSLPGVEAIGNLSSLASSFRGDAWKHMSLDAARKAEVEQEMDRYKAEFGKGLASYEKTITTDQDRELYQRIPPALEQFLNAWEGPKALSREGKNQEAAALYMEKVDPAYRKFMAAIDAEVAFNSTNAKKNAAAVAHTVSVARFWIWVLGIASIAAGCLLAVMTVRGIGRTLVSVVEELSTTAAQVGAASVQVAQASQELASGASEQAASIEETSASTEELTSMTRKNADNAENASKLMGQTVANVETLNRAHEELGHAIGEVNTSSDKISKIIKVIDEIAFQTNILALNAAVEAARAGEAGQGFAVVADEVRNLARRSADAAKETAALIQESIAKARDGKVKLDQALKAVEANNTLSLQVKTNTDEVNLGSQEQAKGLEQIARAISQMEGVVQRTAASAEEGASSGAELENQAKQLRAAVERLQELAG